MELQTFVLDNLFSQAQDSAGTAQDVNSLLINTECRSTIVDQVDGKVIIRNTCVVQAADGSTTVADLAASDNLSLQLLQGQAIIQREPYTGDMLVMPKGNVPVIVRSVLETTLQGAPLSIYGPEQTVGIDIRNVAAGQQELDAVAGGGACAARWAMYDDFDFQVRVRAFMPANVIPLSLDTRQINWRYGMYFAFDPQVGLMRLRYNPEFQTKTVLHSNAPQGGVTPANFFPASGQNDLYFFLDMLDMGFTCFNKVPMVQIYANTEWPPYSTVLTINKPVDFYNLENPDQLMLTILENDMQIYDYGSISVDLLHQEIDAGGFLRSRWRFTNQSPERISARWFALGEFKNAEHCRDQGSRMLGPSGSGLESYEVDFNVQLKKSSLSQFITMNMVSLNDPVIMGSHRFNFVYPAV